MSLQPMIENGDQSKCSKSMLPHSEYSDSTVIYIQSI